MVDSVSGADMIGQRVQEMAFDAGLGKIGITWDDGQRFVVRGRHVLTIFRGSAMSTAKFSQGELEGYPDGLQKARTESKLNAMVRQMSRRLKKPWVAP